MLILKVVRNSGWGLVLTVVPTLVSAGQPAVRLVPVVPVHRVAIQRPMIHPPMIQPPMIHQGFVPRPLPPIAGVVHERRGRSPMFTPFGVATNRDVIRVSRYPEARRWAWRPGAGAVRVVTPGPAPAASAGQALYPIRPINSTYVEASLVATFGEPPLAPSPLSSAYAYGPNGSGWPPLPYGAEGGWGYSAAPRIVTLHDDVPVGSVPRRAGPEAGVPRPVTGPIVYRYGVASPD